MTTLVVISLTGMMTNTPWVVGDRLDRPRSGG